MSYGFHDDPVRRVKQKRGSREVAFGRGVGLRPGLRRGLSLAVLCGSSGRL
ncbi:hypothetical protein ACPOL_2359 [Acidisarcina polymorpha]|uniref:Uncharacterized protein n=1 Tax=Acidisarcina polymorpha TaxID=2211140 RepID=A0A2Z5FXR8_9BACT|nr:hypothetical protein ACPOL_2359 [Acidisarcina polymorpha]